MLFDKYPYTDFHELNLDWIIRTIKELDHAIDDFVAYNKVTFLGVWDGSPYPAWTIVDDGLGNGYLSIRSVPANVPLTDTTYWTPVASYSSMYSAFNSRLTTVENNYVPKTRTVNGNALSANVTVNSAQVPYDHTVSGLSATNVKAAIDEIDATVDNIGNVASISNTVSVVQNTFNDVCSLTLQPNHTYLVTAYLNSSLGDPNSIMSLTLAGMGSSQTVRSVMDAGGGLTYTRAYQPTSTEIITLKTYGYSSNVWDAYGFMQAICIK